MTTLAHYLDRRTMETTCGQGGRATTVMAHVTCPRCVQRQGPEISEAALMAALKREAVRHGWKFYHTYRSTRSEPGFFDVVLAKPGLPVIMAELKTASGVVTIAQQQWYEVVQQSVGLECYLWRPDNWPDIVALLTRDEA